MLANEILDGGLHPTGCGGLFLAKKTLAEGLPRVVHQVREVSAHARCHHPFDVSVVGRLVVTAFFKAFAERFALALPAKVCLLLRLLVERLAIF